MENSNIEKNSKINGVFLKIKDFFKGYYGYFAIPLFVLAVFTVAFIFFGIWPFGSAIIASYDMLAQICPILEHFFDFFDGTSGLFHTFRLGGGMDMFGILAYCAVSPFTLLLLAGGQGHTVYMVSIVLPLKVACIGISAFIFLRRYFKSIPQYIQVVLALLYAYSGYVYVANTYIIWMDLMIYMPLLGAGIIEFSRKKSIKLLAISLAIMIYTCFSIVCFSFFTLFPVLVCFILITKKKGEWKEFLSKLCLAFVIAVGVSLPILLPSLFAYMEAGRNTGLFSRVFEVMSQSDVEKGKLNTHIYEKLTYILTDSAFIFLTVVYFLRSKKGDKRALFLIVALLFLFLPIFVDESMLLLNMGSYYSYALRFGFLSSFFFFYVSALSVEDILKGFESEPTRGKLKNNLAMVITTLLTVVGAVFSLLFFKFIHDGDFGENNFITKLIGETEGVPFKDFFPLFAHSEGGLEGSAVLFAVITVILVIVALLIKFKFVKFTDVASFLCILALSQTVFYNFSLVKGDQQSFSAQKFDYYKQMLDDLDDDEIYRLKSYDYYISSDSPLIIGSYAHTLFSSMADAKNITAPKFFGYGGSLTNSTRSNYGSDFSDSLLGYKYVVYSAEHKSSAEGLSRLVYTGVSAHGIPSVKISKTDGGNTQTVNWQRIDGDIFGKGKWTKLKITVSGNTFTGYYGGQKFLSVDMASSEIAEITVSTQNAFGKVKNITVKDKNGNALEGEWNIKSGFALEDGAFVSTKENGKISFGGNLDGVRTFEAEVCFTEGTASDDFIGLEVYAKKPNSSEKTAYRLVIEPNVEFFLYENTHAFPLVSVIDGSDVGFTVDYDNKAGGYYSITKILNGGEPLIAEETTYVSSEKIVKLRDKLKQTEVKYTLSKNTIKTQKFTAEKGQLLYLNYVNLDGYKAYVNGEERQIKQNGLDFMFVELDEGENVVEIRYTSPYIKFIIIGIALAAVIVAACWFIYKKKPIIFEKASVVLPYAAVLLAIGLTVFFFIFPTGVYFKKLFTSYMQIIF